MIMHRLGSMGPLRLLSVWKLQLARMVKGGYTAKMTLGYDCSRRMLFRIAK